MIQEILNAGLAPFTEQVGWQGVAYGLLGVKTIKKTIATVIKMRRANTEGEEQTDG